MAQYVTIRVVGRDGRPKKGARVGLYLSRFLASGFKPDAFTDSEGKAEFTVDETQSITIYVDGKEMLKDHEVESNIKITL